MSWIWIAVAAGACLVLKVTGLLVPARVLENPAVARVSQAMPIALLAALIAVQTFVSGHRVGLDARVAGLLTAGVALRLRAPFLVVVLSAAATTAALRWFDLAG
ncbi:AzlD domain-containing protein [Kitasatospora sp. NPDC058170]|uniref:AzlD domain-containing protein n=1 Tax=Kitasatospora sp. NPDC058170 TaxID=3346364 RepID=UPI0036D991E0